METTKVISFLGMERCDMIVYLINAMQSKKARTLVFDNSISQDLFGSLKRADEASDYMECGRTTYMRNKCVNYEHPEVFEKFDVVIIYHGLNANLDLLDLSDYVIFQTDYIPATCNLIQSYLDMSIVESIEKEKFAMVYRDKGSSKISEQLIKKLYGLTGVEQEYVIYFDEGNFNAYLNFCWNGIQKNVGLSAEMRNVIGDLKKRMVGEDKKKVEKEKSKQDKEVSGK